MRVPTPKSGRWLFFVATLMLVVLGAPRPASAHTGFESSDPMDRATVTGDLDTITITFTGPAEPTVDGFVVLDPSGTTRVPTETSKAEDRIFALSFEPPLGAGDVGVRWSVQAPDAHPIEDTFSFTIAVDPSATAPTASSDGLAGTTVTGPTTSAQAATPSPSEQAGTIPADSTLALEEFLAVDDSSPGDRTALVGRIVGLLGLVLAFGAAAFLATTLRGSAQETHSVLVAARLFGALISLGAIIEYFGTAAMSGDSLLTAWTSDAGFATLLRLAGGILFASSLGSRMRTIAVPEHATTSSLVGSAMAGPSSVAGGQRADGAHRRLSDRHRWTPNASSWPAAVGVALVLGSFWFDGHTVSKGPRLLHVVVDTIHVAAGSVWAGGVISMAAIAWWRHTRNEPPQFRQMVVRFSSVATVALVAVTIAGSLMAFIVLDSVGDLFGTAWGRILIIKTLAVGVAATAGAFNHFMLLPRLKVAPGDPSLDLEIRRVVTVEAISLFAVVIITGWLVAASST